MKLPLRIALRYLFAKKSHNVINIISGISIAGMAVGAAALVIIMSVFNGFNDIVDASLTDMDPDLKITPVKGKVFVPDSCAVAALVAEDEIMSISGVLEESVFLSYDGRQSLAKAKGVDLVWEEESPVREHIIAGQFILHSGDLPRAVMGASLAWSLGVNPNFLTRLELYYPTRKGSISPANPLGSVGSVKARPSGLISAGADVDASLVIVPLETMRALLEYDEEISALELRTAPGLSKRTFKALRHKVEQVMGPEFRVRDRRALNESIYRMMRYEKLAIFMILIFVTIIIAFNVLSSQTMLIIEKEQDIWTLRSLGMGDESVRRIFALEGFFVTLTGLVAGIIIGVAVVLLQQYTGMIKLPGNYLIEAYPVRLSAADILWTFAGVAVTGYLLSLFPTRKI